MKKPKQTFPLSNHYHFIFPIRLMLYLLISIIIFGLYVFCLKSYISHPDETFYLSIFASFHNKTLNLESFKEALFHNPYNFTSPAYCVILAITGLIFKTSNILIYFQILLLSLIAILSDYLKKRFYFSLFVFPSVFFFTMSYLRESWMLFLSFLFCLNLENKNKVSNTIFTILILILMSLFRVPLAIALAAFYFFFNIYKIKEIKRYFKILVLISVILLVVTSICLAIGFKASLNLNLLLLFVSNFVGDNIGLTTLKTSDFKFSDLLVIEKYVLICNLYIIYKSMTSSKNFLDLFPYIAFFVIYYLSYFFSWHFMPKGSPLFSYRIFLPVLPLLIFTLRYKVVFFYNRILKWLNFLWN